MHGKDGLLVDCDWEGEYPVLDKSQIVQACLSILQDPVLSGGQRQRLAIARVILKRPDILILDESASALDRATEDQMLGELHGMMAGKTTLISTHRIETIQSADIIYVLDSHNNI
ncbi:ATP-binding cassette domain-containing protein [Fontibacillus phaseoli]|uniref:ATP-binding cassette domain-containing protein n=1 Tax=Fontibacillus phaseoli TaxID=1416533 RepID=UPI001C69AC18|nr:ATP-binding cassette domain-containing protein [Fontibacillus phaseoli]